MKKIFYLIILGLLVFIPKNVFAKMQSIKVNQVAAYSIVGNVVYQNGQFVANGFSGNYLHFNWPNDSYSNYIDILLDKSSFNGLNYNHYYNIVGSMQIVAKVGSSTTETPKIDIILIQQHNSSHVKNQCTFTTNYTSGQLLNIDFTCRNVQVLENLNYLIAIYFGKELSFTTFGILKELDFQELSSNQQILVEQQVTNEKLDETNQQLGDLNNNITNSDTSDASSSADEFFSGFESDDFGLSSIITAPLNLIKSITSSTCTPIGFKAPFVNQQVTLPCMNAIYREHFGTFLTIYQTITFGMVAYWVSVKIFFMVKGFKDPDSDRIEVLDL